MGQRAVDQGLVDGVGHLMPVLQQRFGDKVRLKRFGQRRGLLARFGLNIAQDAMAAVEERSLLARFGL